MDIRNTFIKKPHPVLLVVILVVSVWLLINATYTPTEDVGTISDAEGATVLEVLSERDRQAGPTGRIIPEQRLLVRTETDEEIEILNDFTPLEPGDRVYINILSPNPDEITTGERYVIQVQKEGGLLWLTALFVLLAIAVSGWKGVRALIGLAFSLAMVFSFILPRILSGADPVITGVVGAVIILLVSIYASHGLNRKSVAALSGIALSLVVVALLAKLSLEGMNFTGFVGEEAFYLGTGSQVINLLGLAIAGIIIAGIGVLDDVAITQASTVFALRSVKKELRGLALFKKAMEVGRDHIAAVINTLVLAYTGAALPLLLLVTQHQFPLDFVVSNERIAEEIARTLVSSSGLLLAVPLTTLIAVWMLPDHIDEEDLEAHMHIH